MSEMYAEFHLEVRGNTLLIKVIGPTGVEELNWLRQEISDKYLGLLTPPWAIFGDARKWELYTPEAKKDLDAFSLWIETQGMGFNVVLAPEGSIKQAAAKDLQIGYTIEHHYVSSMEEGIEWLSSRQLWGDKKA